MNKVKSTKDINDGDIFGRLTIINCTGSHKGKRRFSCLCECGKIHTVLGYSLVSGHTISCGCYRRQNRRTAAQKEPGAAAYSSLFSACRGGAKNRKLIFNTTKEQHKEIISKNCHYCSKPPRAYNPYISPSQINTALKESISRSWILVNGIDRIDNKVGYEIYDCVPCCTECNEGKSDRPVHDFIERAYRIVDLDKKRKNNA